MVSEGVDHGDFVQTSQWQKHMTESVFHLVVDRKQKEERYRKRLGLIELPRIYPQWKEDTGRD